MRIDQINKAGGVLGKQIKVEWIDTKSDKPTAATNAEELISKGAVAIIATCDFDFSFPATNAAARRRCSASRSARRRRRSPRRRSSAPTAARWASAPTPRARRWPSGSAKHKPALKRAYVLKDTSLEYSKATADYFKARWKQLGGKICGEDTFVGGTNLDLSSQMTRLRGEVRAAT